MKNALIFLFSFSSLLLSAFAEKTPDVRENRLPTEAIEALGVAKEFILYSLDPGPKNFEPRPPPGPEGSLNGFKILGSLRLSDPKSLSIALSALKDAIRAADYRLMMRCFLPRHALRVTADGKVFDFMICYECQQIRLYEGGARGAVIGIPDSPEPLNGLLFAAKIPLPAPPSKK